MIRVSIEIDEQDDLITESDINSALDIVIVYKAHNNDIGIIKADNKLIINCDKIKIIDRR